MQAFYFFLTQSDTAPPSDCVHSGWQFHADGQVIFHTCALPRALTFVIAFMVLFASATASDTLFINSSHTWSDTAHIWSKQVSAANSSSWIPNAAAVLEAPAGSLNVLQCNPILRALSARADFSIQSQSSERLEFSAADSSVIDVAAAHALTLKTPLVSAGVLSKTSGGSLVLGSEALRCVPTLHLCQGQCTLSDVAPSPALRALRSSTLLLDSACSLSFSSTANAADVHAGNLGGSGSVSVSGASANGLILQLDDSSHSYGSLSAGTNGALFCMPAGTSQELSGSCSGVNGSWTLCGHRTNADGDASALVFSGAAGTTRAVVLRGGTLILDNRQTASSTRLGSSSAATLNCNGGTLCLRGAASGTNQHIGIAGTKAMTLNAGLMTLRIEDDSATSTGSQLLLGGANSNFSLRDNTAMMINFEVNRGTLGGSASSDARIAFLGSGQPFIGLGGLLANTATSGTPGFALVNGNSFASYGSNGVKAASFTVDSTIAQVQASSTSSVVDFQPHSNLSLSANLSAAALRLSPQGADSLACGTKNIISTALMLDADSNFTLSGSGTFGSGVNTRYVVVCRPSSTLRCTQALGSTASPITKGGEGTLDLCATSNQLAFSSANNVNVLQGALRLSAASMGGEGAGGNANCSINLRGGLLELSGGMNFVRALDQTPSASGGSVSFDAGSTSRGSGGFAAVGGASTVSLVTTVGGSTPAALQWNDNAFVPAYSALLLNAVDADSRIDLTNDIQLDNGTAGEYAAREVYVSDNPSSDSDCARLSGVISGSSSSDLVKTGAGSLELAAQNTFGGNVLLLRGTLRCINAHALPSTASVIVKHGILRIDASQQIRDLVVENGASVDVHQDTLSISGMLSIHGGQFIGNGVLRFNGGEEQIINGACQFKSVVLDNPSGVQCNGECRITTQLHITQGKVYNNGGMLRLDSAADISGASQTSGWIVGPLPADFDANHASHEMAIGDSLRFSPVTIQCSGISQAGTLSCESVRGVSSHLSSSDLDFEAAVQRHYLVHADNLACDTWSCTMLIDTADYAPQRPRDQLRARMFDGQTWTAAPLVHIDAEDLRADSLTSFGELQCGVPHCGPLIIISQAGEYGHIFPSDTLTLSCGATQSYSIVADSCATVDHVEVDGVDVGAPSTYTFNTIQAAHTIRSWFQSNVVHPSVQIQSDVAGDSVCRGQTLHVHASSENGGASPLLQWLVNGEMQETQGSDFALSTANDGDEVQCRLVSSESCAVPAVVTSELHVLHVIDNPVAEITRDNAEWCPGTTQQCQVAANAEQILWTVEGAAEIVGADNAQQLVVHCDDARFDSVHVHVTLTNTLGCSTESAMKIIVMDTTAPSLSIPADRSISCDEANDPCACGQATATDACTDVVVAHQDSVAEYECAQHFSIYRRWSAIDMHGNLASGIQHIEVNDTTAPTIECPSDQTLNCAGDIPPSAHNRQEFESQGGWCTDKCSATLSVELLSEEVQGSLADNSYQLTRRYKATDACGNSASAAQRIAVFDDMSPTLSMSPLDHWWSTLELDSSFDVTAADNCDGAVDIHWTILDEAGDSTASGIGSVAGTYCSVGQNTVFWNVSDTHGNTSSARQSISVVQSGNGHLSIPSELHFAADPLNCTYSFQNSKADATVDDNCPSYVVQNSLTHSASLAGLTLPSGSYSVVWSLRDICGSIDYDTCTIVVEDTTAPVAHSKSLTLFLDASGQALLSPEMCDDGSWDACGIVSRSCSRTQFGCAQLGFTTDTLRVVDGAGNSTEAVCIVNVVDTIAPTIATKSATVELDSNGEAEVDVSMVDAGFIDNCQVLNSELSQTHFSCNDLGEHQLLVRVWDASGNKSSATAEISVVDHQVPKFLCPTQINLACHEQSCVGQMRLPCPILDNCTVGGGRSAQILNEPGVAVQWLNDTLVADLHRGQHYVLLHAWDAAGNSCSSRCVVTVRDTTPPTLMLKSAVIALNSHGKATLHTQDVNAGTTDNCSPYSLSLSRRQFHCEDLGYQNVIVTARDQSGNCSSAVVQIQVADHSAPVVHTKSVSKTLSNGSVDITAAMVDNGSTDNCSIATRSLSKTHFSCADVGQHSVILTVTDASGNSSTGRATVTIGPELHSSISYTPDQSAYTGRPQTELFLGYGAQSVTLHAHASGGNGWSYQWSPSTALNCTTCANPVFHPQQSGEYSYTLTVTNAQGCSTQSHISFCVRDARVNGQPGKVHVRHGSQHQVCTVSQALQHLQGHSNDHLGYNDDDLCQSARRAAEGGENNESSDDSAREAQHESTSDTSLTDAERQGLTISVLPDPFHDECEIRCESRRGGSIRLRVVDLRGDDMTGALTLSSGQTVVCGKDWPAGMYLIVAEQDNIRRSERMLKLH